MLTMKHRFSDRIQQLNFNSEYSPRGNSEHSTHVLPSARISELTNEELLEKINKIEQEKENIHRENVFFSRYLLRINTRKIVERFDEYEDENANDIIREILNQAKLADATQRLANKKSSNNAKKGTSGWTKVSVNWGERMYTSYMLRIEQERLSVAAYEAEQTRLDWKRMKANADAELYNLEIFHQSIESDEIAQEALNRDLERRVDKYRADIGEEEFNSRHMHVPAELVVSRINKRIYSRISEICLLRVNTRRLHTRIQEINENIRSFNDLNGQTVEVDIISARTRKIDNSEIYEQTNRKYRKEKSSQYPLFRRLQEDKKLLNEQERNINDMKKKCELIQNHFERTIIEINCIEQEYQLLLKENHSLKNRIADVIKVPTITDYAYIMEQTKVLQHGIDIWTKRVNIAETLLSHLKQQEKPPRRLPPLKSATTDQDLLTKPLNE